MKRTISSRLRRSFLVFPSSGSKGMSTGKRTYRTGTERCSPSRKWFCRDRSSALSHSRSGLQLGQRIVLRKERCRVWRILYIPPLTADSLNAKDGSVWQVGEDDFEDLGGVEYSLPRRISGHETSRSARSGVERVLALLGKLLAMVVAQ